MNSTELDRFRELYPNEIGIWYDNMLQKSKGELVAMVLQSMEPVELHKIVRKINTEMEEERRLDDGPQ